MIGGGPRTLFVLAAIALAATGSRALAGEAPPVRAPAADEAPPVRATAAGEAPPVRATAADEAPPVRATAADEAPPACGVALDDRAPDPRCGEALDGRPEDKPGPALTVPQAALFLPKETSNAVFWPIVGTTELVERHHVPNWIEALTTSDDGLIGFRPELYYSTSFISTVGGRVFFRRFPGKGTEVAARALTGGPSVLYGQLQLRGPDWTGLSADASFDRRRDRLFAGIGPNTSAALADAGLGLGRFGSDIMMVNLRWNRRIERRLAGFAYGDVQRRQYQATNVRSGPSVTTFYNMPQADCAAAGLAAPCVSPAYMPGFNQGLRIAHAGGGVAFDARSHDRDGSGFGATLDGAVGHGVAGDPTEDARVSAEAVGAIGGTDKVFFLRGRAAMVSSLNGTVIPFDELVSPAGRLGMRGFPDGRFRGDSGVVASAEYRYYIASQLDASLFTDVGTVAGPAFSGLLSDHWFPDFGVGFRFYSQRVPHWQANPTGGIEIAYAPDGGVRVLFALAGF
jgi:hypothetical protein